MFLQAAKASDQPAIQQSADNGTQGNPEKSTEAKECKGQHNAQSAAAAIVDGLYLGDGPGEFLRHLFDHYLVGFRGQICVKQHCHTKGAEKHTADIVAQPPAKCGKGAKRQQSNKPVQNQAVQNCRNKGKKIMLWSLYMKTSDSKLEENNNT
jgi:hypothetical protein